MHAINEYIEVAGTRANPRAWSGILLEIDGPRAIVSDRGTPTAVPTSRLREQGYIDSVEAANAAQAAGEAARRKANRTARETQAARDAGTQLVYDRLGIVIGDTVYHLPSRRNYTLTDVRVTPERDVVVDLTGHDRPDIVGASPGELA